MVPSGPCHCGNVAFYYAGGQLFCEEHKAEAVDIVRAEYKTTVAGEQMVKVRHRFRFSEDEISPIRLSYWGGSRVHNRYIDRPTYNI